VPWHKKHGSLHEVQTWWPQLCNQVFLFIRKSIGSTHAATLLLSFRLQTQQLARVHVLQLSSGMNHMYTDIFKRSQTVIFSDCSRPIKRRIVVVCDCNGNLVTKLPKEMVLTSSDLYI
jgi:hypothetical protein